MRTFLFLLYLSVSSLSWAVAEEANAKKTGDSLKLNTIPSGGGLDNDGETSSDILIEENPDYVPVEESSLEKGEDFSDSDSDSDDVDDDSDDDDEDDAKSKMSKKLKKAKKGRVEPFKLLKKNRGRITIALAVFAFRKEIFMLLLQLFELSASTYTTTGVLKLVLFVDFMRRMQTGGMSALGGSDESPSIRKTIGAMIDKTMDSNPAYVPPITQHFAFESLNEYYVKDGMALQKAIRKRHVGLKWPSSSTLSIGSHFASSKSDSRNKNNTGTKSKTSAVEDNGRTVVVLDWTKLDEQITSMNQLRQQIAFLLSEYRGLVMEGEQATNLTMGNDSNDSELSSPAPALEVVVLLESPGGSVSEYGLAGQHLLRLRNEPGITLTICVDKVAASGGYLLCCTASPGKLFAAPFALLGSIGVIATTINVNKLLTNWGIQPLEFRGGKYKAPIGMIGRVSKAGKRVTQTMIDDIHSAFKQHVVNARPILKNKIEEIGNGSVWLGVDAIDLGLVDSIKTSDEYIEEMIRDGTRVFKMVQAPRTGFLFGPMLGNFNTIYSKLSPAMKGPSTSTSTQEDVVEGLMQKSKTMMLRLPAHAKSMFSKSLQSFQ